MSKFYILLNFKDEGIPRGLPRSDKRNHYEVLVAWFKTLLSKRVNHPSDDLRLASR